MDLFCIKWGNNQGWINKSDGGPHEANFLKLDCSRIKKVFGWAPRWSVENAIEKTVEWAKVYCENGDVNLCMNAQIKEFFQLKGI